MTINPDNSQTTAFVIYNPRGMEFAVCLNRATAEAITDRAYGCYLRELPIAEDVSALERFRR